MVKRATWQRCTKFISKYSLLTLHTGFKVYIASRSTDYNVTRNAKSITVPAHILSVITEVKFGLTVNVVNTHPDTTCVITVLLTLSEDCRVISTGQVSKNYVSSINVFSDNFTIDVYNLINRVE
ncbi:hypothetical protein pzkkv7_147 [Klebsiella phage pzk-kv7]|nr:hypothetical protein pzkkv7_147 [Klebsiella phage pzk-kv7]